MSAIDTIREYFVSTTVPTLVRSRQSREEAALLDTTAWMDLAVQLIGVNVNLSNLSAKLAETDDATFEGLTAKTVRNRLTDARSLLKVFGNDVAAFWSAVDDENDERDRPIYSIQGLVKLFVGAGKSGKVAAGDVATTFVLDGANLAEIADLDTLTRWMDAIADRIVAVKAAEGNVKAVALVAA